MRRRRSKQEPQPAAADFGSDWEWADSVNAIALRRMSWATRTLFKQPERWIHRRVERIYFKDHQIAHHQVSVDFTLPNGLPAVSKFDGKDVFIAPLFLLAKSPARPPREGKRPRRRFFVVGERRFDPSKRPIPTAPYSNLDLTDQAGQRLSLLTRRQSSLLAKTVLLEAAERALGEPVVGDLRRQISTIPYRSWSELEDVLAFILEQPARRSDQRRALRKDKEFPELAHTLASHSIIACLLLDGPPRRSLYKLSYDEPLNEGLSTRKGRLRRSFGWIPEEYTVPLNEIGASESYHVEIVVPKELLIHAVGLIGKRYQSFGKLFKRKNLDYFIRQVGSVSEGEVYIPMPLPGRRVGLASVELRVRRAGFLTGALIASFITTTMLGLGAVAAPIVERQNQSEAATAALLLIPTLVAVYIARPGEHPITAKMLRMARGALVVNAILPVIAVFFLVTTPEEKGTQDWVLGPFRLGHPSIAWIVLTGLSALFIPLFVANNILPRPRGETIYRPMPTGDPQ